MKKYSKEFIDWFTASDLSTLVMENVYIGWLAGIDFAKKQAQKQPKYYKAVVHENTLIPVDICDKIKD